MTRGKHGLAVGSRNAAELADAKAEIRALNRQLNEAQHRTLMIEGTLERLREAHRKERAVLIGRIADADEGLSEQQRIEIVAAEHSKYRDSVRAFFAALPPETTIPAPKWISDTLGVEMGDLFGTQNRRSRRLNTNKANRVAGIRQWADANGVEL